MDNNRYSYFWLPPAKAESRIILRNVILGVVGKPKAIPNFDKLDMSYVSSSL